MSYNADEAIPGTRTPHSKEQNISTKTIAFIFFGRRVKQNVPKFAIRYEDAERVVYILRRVFTSLFAEDVLPLKIVVDFVIICVGMITRIRERYGLEIGYMLASEVAWFERSKYIGSSPLSAHLRKFAHKRVDLTVRCSIIALPGW